MIRKFERSDAEAVSELIAQTLRTTNAKDYTAEYIENLIQTLTPAKILDRAGWMHLYVACEDGQTVGCGAIGPYRGREDESCLFTIFVLPAYQGRGIGRAIMEALEGDEFFLRARRVEIPASITACGFYQKLGYRFQNGVEALDGEQLFHLEKFR